MDVKHRADKWMDNCATRAMAARENAERSLVALNNDIKNRLEIVEGSRSAEIRAHFSSLKREQRISMANAAIENSDKETMAAILTGPAYLSGFEDKDRDALRKIYIEKLAPDLLKRKLAIEKAIALNNRALDEAIDATGQLFPHGRVAEISKRMANAKAVKDSIFQV